jgi:hypothetical protein
MVMAHEYIQFYQQGQLASTRDDPEGAIERATLRDDQLGGDDDYKPQSFYWPDCSHFLLLFRLSLLGTIKMMMWPLQQTMMQLL